MLTQSGVQHVTGPRTVADSWYNLRTLRARQPSSMYNQSVCLRLIHANRCVCIYIYIYMHICIDWHTFTYMAIHQHQHHHTQIHTHTHRMLDAREKRSIPALKARFPLRGDLRRGWFQRRLFQAMWLQVVPVSNQWCVSCYVKQHTLWWDDPLWNTPLWCNIIQSTVT